MTKIMVTGNAGFVGGYVWKLLDESGCDIIGIDKKNGVEIGDLQKSDYGKPDYICHLAAVGDIYVVNNNPINAYKRNVVDVARVCEFAKYSGARLIHASTWECYTEDNPSHYVASKKAAELVIKAYKIPATIFRLGTVYAPGMRESTVIAKFINAGKTNQPLKVNGRGQFRQFIHAEDVANAFKTAIENLDHWDCPIYNIIGKEKIYIADLAEAIGKKYNNQIEIAQSREEPRLLDLEPVNDFNWQPEKKFYAELEKMML